MAPLGALVPARFLTLTAHLVALGTAAGARDTHVRASLPLEFSAEEYARVDAELLGALGGAAGLLAIEFGGFFMGVSMFHRGQGLLSLGAHTAAAISLGLALLEGWDLGSFWLLLGLCSAPPAVTELLLLAAALGRRGKLSP
uniref:Transmembrane protein 107 n=1 Tax=Cairina moschata TaxID=8855 RepID=A0A8C3CDS7_CAIMO